MKVWKNGKLYGGSLNGTVMYICDQKRCKNCDVRNGIADKTGWACKHTFDIRHAKNWKSQPPKKTLEKHFIFTNNGFENLWMEKEEKNDK